MKKIILLISMIIVSTNIQAQNNLRDCLLLPVVEKDVQADNYTVFEDLEKFIKSTKICTYKSNSQILEILSDYKKNFNEHLNNKDVLAVISNKSGAGALIKVELEKISKSYKVKLEVIGENGKDLYFKEQSQINTEKLEDVSELLKKWLMSFEKSIPYDGLVKGIIGDQLTIDIDRETSFSKGSQIVILRPMEKNKHPLIKDVVDYKSEKIAIGSIFDLNNKQAQAKIYEVVNNQEIKPGDWIVVEKKNIMINRSEDKDKKVERNDIGRYGQIALTAKFGTADYEQFGSEAKSGSGINIGINLDAEIWATRNYFANIEIGKTFTKYENKTGSYSEKRLSTTNGVTKILGGYRHLPLNFFYGPQLDIYGGYAKYSYDLKPRLDDKVTNFAFKGLLVGARANFPVEKNLRVYAEFDFLLFNSFQQKQDILGNDNDASTYRFEAGAQIAYAANMSYQFSFEYLKSKAEFSKPSITEMQFDDISAKVGAIFSF